MKRILRWLFGISALKLIQLKKGDCLLVTMPAEHHLSRDQARHVKEIFEQHVGKRVIVTEPGFDLTVIRPPGD